MTMNNINNNVPSSTEGVMLPAHMQQRSIRPPLMSKGLTLLSHNIGRKPVRRALLELGRNDRKHNVKLANRLLTISTEEFKQKWNFDPIKMKPITEGSDSATTTTAIISGDRLGQKKYQWELVKHTKEQEQEYKDKKELERTVFSLVTAHTDRRQLRLATVAVQASQTDDASREKASSTVHEASSSRIPQLKEESMVSSTTEEESSTVSAVTKSITDNGSNSQQQKQQPQSITVASNEQRAKEEELRKRLTADDASTAAASVDAVPTITSATITNNTLSSRQSKITDFASNRKIVHGPAHKEETDLQPPSKRPRLTC